MFASSSSRSQQNCCYGTHGQTWSRVSWGLLEWSMVENLSKWDQTHRLCWSWGMEREKKDSSSWKRGSGIFHHQIRQIEGFISWTRLLRLGTSQLEAERRWKQSCSQMLSCNSKKYILFSHDDRNTWQTTMAKLAPGFQSAALVKRINALKARRAYSNNVKNRNNST